jgi:DNA polymerase III delta prime subunit
MEYIQDENDSILVKYIKDRIYNKNKNFLMLFVGPTGSGKSLAALRLAESIDPSFNINRCCFKAKEFLLTIKKYQKIAENNPEDVTGKVVLWDELGVEHDVKRFMTVSNRVVNYIFQTSRYLNLVILMTVPLLTFVDSSTRKLTHCIGEVKGINMRKKTSSVAIKMLQSNPITGKEYAKYLRYRKGNRQFKLRTMHFKLPSPELRDTYERKRQGFTDWLYQDNIERLERKEQKDTGVKKPLTELQTKILALWNQGITNQTEIGKRLGKMQQQISDNIQFMRNKGYNLTR